MLRPVLALCALLPLVACGPVSLQQAERECFQRARLAQQPRGAIGLGVGSDGKVVVGGDVTVSTDYIQGRDPSQVYDACVYQRSGGQMPSRPFTSLPAAQN